MATSQNGYTVISREDCKFYDIEDVVDLPLRPDDCGWLLARFARKFHRRVEPLGSTQTFGHSERKIGGTDEWSNHASGTALDLNSALHPFDKGGTFDDEKLNALRNLLQEFDHIIKWGGDYRFTPDEMHFEIDKPYSEVQEFVKDFQKHYEVNLKSLVPGKTNNDIMLLKKALLRHGYFRGELTPYFGKGLTESYIRWQEHLGFEGDDADGIPGRTSLEALGLEVKEVKR